jgi:hypothetical protein
MRDGRHLIRDMWRSSPASRQSLSPLEQIERANLYALVRQSAELSLWYAWVLALTSASIVISCELGCGLECVSRSMAPVLAYTL